MSKQEDEKQPVESFQRVIADKFFCGGQIMLIAIRDERMNGWRAYIGQLNKNENTLALEERRKIVLETGSKLNRDEASGMFSWFNIDDYII